MISIRKDIEIFPFDTASSSQKYLVVAGKNRRFEISENIYLLISLIDGKTSPEQIAEKYSERTNTKISVEEVNRIIKHYLTDNGILESGNADKNVSRKKSVLAFKKTVLPQKYLRRLTDIFKYMFVKPVFVLTLSFLLFFTACFFFFFDSSGMFLTSLEGKDMIPVYLIFFITTFFHELGHASSCRYYNAKHGDIGIGLYLYFPVFYTDVTDAWKLNRQQRGMVDIAGIYFQMLFIPFLFVVYLIYQNLIFIKAIYLLVFSLIATLNPFLRFDGYWLASDLSGIPNLRDRTYKVFAQWFGKITGNKKLYKNQLPQIETKAKIFLYSYTVMSNIFFVLFIYLIFQSIPRLIDSYPKNVLLFYESLFGTFTGPDIVKIWNSFSTIIFPTVFLFILLNFLYSGFKAFSRFLLKRISKRKKD